MYICELSNKNGIYRYVLTSNESVMSVTHTNCDKHEEDCKVFEYDGKTIVKNAVLANRLREVTRKHYKRKLEQLATV